MCLSAGRCVSLPKSEACIPTSQSRLFDPLPKYNPKSPKNMAHHIQPKPNSENRIPKCATGIITHQPSPTLPFPAPRPLPSAASTSTRSTSASSTIHYTLHSTSTASTTTPHLFPFYRSIFDQHTFASTQGRSAVCRI